MIHYCILEEEQRKEGKKGRREGGREVLDILISDHFTMHTHTKTSNYTPKVYTIYISQLYLHGAGKRKKNLWGGPQRTVHGYGAKSRYLSLCLLLT
jgi:hypothetical protein